MTEKTCKNCVSWKPTIYGFGKCGAIREEIEVDITYGWDGGYINFIETPESFGCNKFSEKQQKSGVEDANKEIMNKRGWD